MNDTHTSKNLDCPTKPFVMTCPRLRPVEASLVAALCAVGWLVAPRVALRTAGSDFAGATYRTPYELSEDYWRYRELARDASTHDKTLVLGDSVIWGEFVRSAQSLPAQLNELQSTTRFVNAGINGMHPLAMSGLAEDYLNRLRQQPILLHCNLLWMTSAERDLSDPASVSFNHPRLVPQFAPALPSYDAKIADRLSIVIERHVLFRQWVRHLWIHWLGGQDLARWTLDHPYSWPRRQPPSDTEASRQSDASWQERGIPPQTYPWVPLAKSLQWQAFQRTVHILRQRDNRVFVLVGPFNTHLLTDANREEWLSRRAEIEVWLKQNHVPYLAPSVLASPQYADASHPLATGYRRIAQQLLATEAFNAWRAANTKTSHGATEPAESPRAPLSIGSSDTRPRWSAPSL